MNLGIAITTLVLFGYISNWLNWKYLNYKITHLLYYLGAFVHEGSHAIFCILTGSKIIEFKFLSNSPQVIHTKSKIPLVGSFLISSAPIFGGLFFLFLINHLVLKDRFIVDSFTGDWKNTLLEPIKLISQMRFEWQSLLMFFVFLNIGAMMSPSIQDIKNAWPMIILAFFIPSSFMINLCLIAIELILANIAIQIMLIIFINIFKKLKQNIADK